MYMPIFESPRQKGGLLFNFFSFDGNTADNPLKGTSYLLECMLISTGIKLYNESNKDNVGEVRVISLALVLIVVFIYYLFELTHYYVCKLSQLNHLLIVWTLK